MDFMNRNARTPQSGAQHTETSGPSSSGASKRNGKLKNDSTLGKILYVILIAAVVGILVFVVILLMNSNGPKQEKKYVDSSKLQAVFLNGGQVYFGNISTLNKDYLKLNNVYYLRVNNQNSQNTQQSTSANDVSLVKLGCELHGPQDQMMITKDQVIFWENLKSDGQVAKAVAEYIKTNPNGQKCEENNSGSTGNNLQSGGTTNNPQNNTGTTNSTNTTNKTTNP